MELAWKCIFTMIRSGCIYRIGKLVQHSLGEQQRNGSIFFLFIYFTIFEMVHFSTKNGVEHVGQCKVSMSGREILIEVYLQRADFIYKN